MAESATYEYRRPFSRVRLDLLDDSVHAVGKFHSSEFDSTLSFDRLDPNVDRVWNHDTEFTIGYWLAILSVVILIVISIVVEMIDYRGSFLKPYFLVGCVATIGFGLVFIHRRKIEHVVVKNNAGVPALAIPRDPRKGAEFDQFVDLLVGRIRRLRDANRDEG